MDHVKLLASKFKKNSNKDNSNNMKSYMRNKFEFYGIKTPQRRRIFREVKKDLGLIEKKELFNFIKKVWNYPQREMQYAGVDMALEFKNDIHEDDMKILEYMIVNKSWWDIVDTVSQKLVGNYLKKFHVYKENMVRSWLNTNNIWLWRNALLFQLKYKKDLDVDLLISLVQELKDVEKFFIQKAIGWILREYSKTDPEFVNKFLKQNKNSLSKLAFREGHKWIKKPDL